jgi:hypothetical protein
MNPIIEIEAERCELPALQRSDYPNPDAPAESGYPRADPFLTITPDGTLYAAYQHPSVPVIHVSDDGGRSWDRVQIDRPPPGGPHGGLIAFGAVADATLVLLYSDAVPKYVKGVREEVDFANHFARSEDGGATWDRLHTADAGGPDHRIHGLGNISMLRDGTVIVTATVVRPPLPPEGLNLADHIWRSNDGGRTFSLGAPIGDHTAETHILPLPSGRLLAAIRTVYADYEHPRNKRSAIAVSDDQGNTWSEPRLITQDIGDCPGEFVLLPDGRLVFLYCHRYPPGPGIYARVSEDEGETWSAGRFAVRVLRDDQCGVYPASVLLHDGVILTISGSHVGVPLQAIRWRVPG